MILLLYKLYINKLPILLYIFIIFNKKIIHLNNDLSQQQQQQFLTKLITNTIQFSIICKTSNPKCSWYNESRMPSRTKINLFKS
jgi:hypothetical protein